jgi:hypothetical protein
MPKLIPGRHGGTLINSLPGETMNAKGRPKNPKSLKDAINAIKNSDGEIVFDKFKLFKDEDGVEKVKVNVPNSEKLALVWIGQALKKPQFAEIINKITGDYAPIKTQDIPPDKTKSIYEDIDYSKLTVEELDFLEKIILKCQNDGNTENPSSKGN